MPAYYIRAAFRASESGSGTLAVSTVHYELDSFTSGPDFATVATEIHAHLGSFWLNTLHASWTFHDVTVTTEDYVGSTPLQGVHSVETAGSLTPTDTKLSHALCGMMSVKTATPKRYARGHMFFPPALDSTTLFTGGGWNAAHAYWTAMSGFVGAFASAFGSGSDRGYTPIVFSKKRAKLNEAPFLFPVTATSVSPIQHFLRSRLTSP